LTYFYANNSNQLKKVVDLTNNTSGFKDDASGTIASDTEDDYNYDAHMEVVNKTINRTMKKSS
jgi:hypothetical protein